MFALEPFCFPLSVNLKNTNFYNVDLSETWIDTETYLQIPKDLQDKIKAMFMPFAKKQ